MQALRWLGPPDRGQGQGGPREQGVSGAGGHQAIPGLKGKVPGAGCTSGSRVSRERLQFTSPFPGL